MKDEQGRHGGTDSEQRDAGVLERVAMELGLKRPFPRRYARSDARIREDVCERLWHEPYIDVSEVSVTVRDGIVVLEGTVPHRQMKHRIEDVSAACAGVHDVENRIRIERAQPAPAGAGNV